MGRQDVFSGFRGSSFFLHPALLDDPVLSLLLIGLSFVIFASPLLKPVREKLGELLFRSGNVKFRLFLCAAGATACRG